MPQNTTINVPSRTWTEITNANAANITFQVGSRCLVKGTAGSVAPTDVNGAVRYPAGSGERNVSLAELWPGIAGVNRVWVYSYFPTSVMVSHA